MDQPRITAVVPNFNHAAYLPDCLQALLRQADRLLEIIVIDDASTDNSLEVIERFTRNQSVFRVYRNEKNRGVVFNLNRGIELARGDYIFFPSADDQILPGLLEKSSRLLCQFPEAALSCTVSRWSYVDSGLTWHMGAGMAERPCYLSPDDLVQVGRRGKLLIPTSSAIIKRESLLKAGGFIPELRWHCDWFATIVVAFRQGMCFVPEPLSAFNIHKTSYYSSGQKRAEHHQVLQKLIELLSSEAYADVKPRVRDSGDLCMFSLPMLGILLRQPEYHYFINAILLRRILRRSAELAGKKILPNRIARWILDRYYKQMPPTQMDREAGGSC